MTVHGRYTGILRDDLASQFDELAQDYPGVDFSSGLHRANMPRRLIDTDTDPLTSGTLFVVPLYLRQGDVVTNLSMKSGATAAGTPTNYWFALYDPDEALLDQTADQTSTAWAANTLKTLALGSAQTIAQTGIHYAAINVTATDPPSLLGKSVALAGASAAWFSGEEILAFTTDDTSLTDTAPATLGDKTADASIPRVVAT